MAKLTLNALKAIVNTELDVNKISVDAPFDADTETLTGLLVKVGEQYSIDSSFQDKLGHLTHNYLEYGTTVEEWFNDLRLPVPHDPNGSTNMAPKDPTFQEVVYSYELPKYVSDTTVRNEDIKKGFLGQSEFSTLTASIMKKLYDSQTLHRYAVKRQLIGRAADAFVAGGLASKLAVPNSTATIEAFAKMVKNKVEEMVDLITEDNNLRGVPARADSLTLYVLPGIRSIIDIDLLAGAFNMDKAQLPVNIVVLEDFGTVTDEGIWAFLVDDRGIRLYPSQNEADSDRNGQGGFTNFYLKEAYTAIYSKVVNGHVFTTSEV